MLTGGAGQLLCGGGGGAFSLSFKLFAEATGLITCSCSGLPNSLMEFCDLAFTVFKFDCVGNCVLIGGGGGGGLLGGRGFELIASTNFGGRVARIVPM